MTDLRLKSPAFPRNRDPILEVLRARWTQPAQILELASGPGEHACYFTQHLPHLRWQPSEPQPEGRASIEAWRHHLGLAPRVAAPLALDVRVGPWPGRHFQGALAINFLHMVDVETVHAALRGVASCLEPGGTLLVYDCFSYQGQHTSPSNQRFDEHLRRNTPGGRVHAFEEIDALAASEGLVDPQIDDLPANNQMVCWRRI